MDFQKIKKTEKTRKTSLDFTCIFAMIRRVDNFNKLTCGKQGEIL